MRALWVVASVAVAVSFSTVALAGGWALQTKSVDGRKASKCLAKAGANNASYSRMPKLWISINATDSGITGSFHANPRTGISEVRGTVLIGDYLRFEKDAQGLQVLRGGVQVDTGTGEIRFPPDFSQSNPNLPTTLGWTNCTRKRCDEMSIIALGEAFGKCAFEKQELEVLGDDPKVSFEPPVSVVTLRCSEMFPRGEQRFVPLDAALCLAKDISWQSD